MSDRLAALRAFYRRLPPARVDALLALGVALIGALEIVAIAASPAGKVQALLLLAVISVAVVVRRRWPLVSIALTMGAIVGFGFLELAVAEGWNSTWFAVLLLIFSFGIHADGWRAWTGAAVVGVGGVVSIATDQYADTPGDYGFVLVFMAAIAMGQMLSGRAALNRALREKAERAEAERARNAEAAVAEERVRIAGELHDVVAHALGAMTVQAAAARRLAETDPTRAREAFRAVEETGRDALGELRRLLGVLRREDDERALAPQPQLAYLGELVQRTRAAGLPVKLKVEGKAPEHLSAGLDVTGYRIVQEALAEALVHGGAGHADVLVRFADAHVHIEVTDDGGVEPRRELMGMRERVRVYGGELKTAAQRPRGHRVQARLPLEAGA